MVAFLSGTQGALLIRGSRMREVFYFLSQFKCAATAACCMFGALIYFLALVKLGLVPTAGVSVIVSSFVGAKGSVGTMMSGRLKSAADGLWKLSQTSTMPLCSL